MQLFSVEIWNVKVLKYLKDLSLNNALHFCRLKTEGCPPVPNVARSGGQTIVGVSYYSISHLVLQ